MTAWIYLAMAGVLEVAWAIGLKYSDGMTRLRVTVITVLLMIASFWFLAQAVRSLPLGTSYAIWTSIGVAGTTILGIILFSESISPLRLCFLMLIVIGVLGLKLSTSEVPPLSQTGL
jgi:quaternary ammonium compound-resistance protein SugE